MNSHSHKNRFLVYHCTPGVGLPFTPPPLETFPSPRPAASPRRAPCLRSASRCRRVRRLCRRRERRSTMAGSGSHLDAFELFDKNHDGKISKNELKAVMKDLGNPITDEEAIDIMHEAGSARTQARRHTRPPSPPRRRPRFPLPPTPSLHRRLNRRLHEANSSTPPSLQALLPRRRHPPLPLALSAPSSTLPPRPRLHRRLPPPPVGPRQTINQSQFKLLLDKAANAPGAASEEQQLREAFSLFDKDGDGKISKKEMKNAVAAFGLELNDRETGLLLDEMNLLVAAKGGDKNSISYELFKKVLLQG